MTTVLFIIVALAASAPIVAAVLVSIASRLEDSNWTLGDPKVGQVQLIARRIVGFHTDINCQRQSPERTPAPSDGSARSLSHQPAPARNRRGKPADSGSRLLVASR